MINTFIGRLHPLIVHLPIGFLLLGILFLILSLNTRFVSLKPAVAFSFGAGAIASLLAIITGYLLSGSGEYDEELLASHQFMGYVTAGIAIAAWLVNWKSFFAFQTQQKFKWISAFAVLVAVSYTGHLGGSLTHGEEYLSFNPASGKDIKRTRDFNQALVFRDLVHPILEDKCGSCHNSSKKKGRLSFASMESILKGGKHGVVIKSGDPAGSEMIKRIQLPSSDRKFMPADNKPPLTSSESRILNWWIKEGISQEDKKLATLALPDRIKEDVAQFFMSPDTLNAAAIADMALTKQFSLQKLPSLPAAKIQELTSKGYQVRFIHYNPDLLDIRMDPSPDSTSIPFAQRIRQLSTVKQHVLWLDVKNAGIKDANMVLLNDFTNLHKLNLSYNPVTDAGLKSLNQLNYLQTINLTGTLITAQALEAMNFKDLRSVYVWRSAITKLDSASLSAYTFRVVAGSD